MAKQAAFAMFIPNDFLSLGGEGSSGPESNGVYPVTVTGLRFMTDKNGALVVSKEMGVYSVVADFDFETGGRGNVVAFNWPYQIDEDGQAILDNDGNSVLVQPLVDCDEETYNKKMAGYATAANVFFKTCGQDVSVIREHGLDTENFYAAAAVEWLASLRNEAKAAGLDVDSLPNALKFGNATKLVSAEAGLRLIASGYTVKDERERPWASAGRTTGQSEGGQRPGRRGPGRQQETAKTETAPVTPAKEEPVKEAPAAETPPARPARPAGGRPAMPTTRRGPASRT